MGALSVTTSGGLLYARDAETGTVYNLVCTARGRLLADADGEDTYPDDAAVQTFGLHVLIDTLGSAGVGTK